MECPEQEQQEVSPVEEIIAKAQHFLFPDHMTCELHKAEDDLKTKKKRSSVRTRYVMGGFVYHNKLIAGTPQMRYLGCAEMKRLSCRARAIMPVNGTAKDIRLTKPHNHPPNEIAEEKEEFLKQLKTAVHVMPGSLKVVYDNIALLYPKATIELPFKSICSSLHRWRKNPGLYAVVPE